MELASLQEKADALAKAIGKAEGFGVPGALPTRCSNPGDMELGDRGYGVEALKTVYAKADFTANLSDKTDGASALRRECMAILSGASHTFESTMTFLAFATRWTGGDSAGSWCKTVTEILNVQPFDRLDEWVAA